MSQNPRILIGCPIRSREWAVEAYFKYAVPAAQRATDNFEFTFVVPEGDTATIEEIEKATLHHEVKTSLVYTNEPSREDKRTWNTDRYQELVTVRNRFLTQARELEPDYLLSLDSDIQIHPEQIKGMIESISENGWDAIGGKTFLSMTGKQHPTYGQIKKGHTGAFRRSDSEGVFKVDIIMAIKMMTSAAYNIDYVANRYGEDIGWSIAAREQGLTLGWDGRFTSKHVMKPKDVDVFDLRCGW